MNQGLLRLWHWQSDALATRARSHPQLEFATQQTETHGGKHSISNERREGEPWQA
jgi:hypothetical protein